MQEAVIVSTARTPIGRAFRGSLNNKVPDPDGPCDPTRRCARRGGAGSDRGRDHWQCPELRNGRLEHRASSRPGCGAAGQCQCPDDRPAVCVRTDGHRHRSQADHGRRHGSAGRWGGEENISAVQSRYFGWVAEEKDPNVVAHAVHAYMPMLETAEIVARKYGIHARRRTPMPWRRNNARPRCHGDRPVRARSCRSPPHGHHRQGNRERSLSRGEARARRGKQARDQFGVVGGPEACDRGRIITADRQPTLRRGQRVRAE